MKKIILASLLMAMFSPVFAKQTYMGPWPLKCGFTMSRAYITYVTEDKTFNHTVMCMHRPNAPTETEIFSIEKTIKNKENQSIDIISILPLSN